MQTEESHEPFVRPANGTEACALSALAMRSKAFWGYSPDFMAACRGELTYACSQIESPDYRFSICEVANRVVGFFAIERQGVDEFELCALFVEPEFIGRGYGRLLMESAKVAAAEFGASYLIIQGDPNAESFYTAAGGVAIGQRESGSVSGRMLPLFRIGLD
ncbi:MAG: GNAT family N-acetyltransferase [Gammaproteobacteria bacterium]